MNKKGLRSASLSVVIVLGLLTFCSQGALADPPHLYRCLGSQSIAWGSCPQGCPTIQFRVKKGAEVKASHTGSPWSWTWLVAWGTGDFTAECSCDSGTTWATAATYTVVHVALYRDNSGSAALDDWPQQGGDLRSPKHVLNQADNIYIRVTGPPGLGNSTFDVKVTSESDTTGVTISLDEISAGVYQNTSAGGELLRLADSSSQGPVDYIQVVEEEVLTFTLLVDQAATGCSQCTKSVMVDKGEYAAGGIQVFMADATEFKDEMEDDRVNWQRAGYQEFANDVGGAAGNAMQLFIENGGASTANRIESDFMLYTCHGEADGDLIDNDSPGQRIMQASDIANGSDWNNDAEWVWSDACLTLNVTGGGRNAWDDALFGAPRPSHMILGYHDDASPDLTGEIDDFFDHAADASPEDIVDSYLHANTDGLSDEPCAIVEHIDNDGDYLKSPTRDTGDTDLRYYWYDKAENEWNHTDYTKGTLTLHGVTVDIRTDLPQKRVQLCPLRASVLVPKKRPVSMKVTESFCGLTTFWKSFTRRPLTVQAADRAEAIALAVLGDLCGGRIPEDAVKVGTGTFYALDFQIGDQIALADGVPFGRMLMYRHAYGNIPIEGDILGAAVCAEDVIKVRSCWHTVTGEVEAEKKQVSSVMDSLAVGVAHLAAKWGGQERLQCMLAAAELVYYGFHQAGQEEKIFTPVWRFRFLRGGRGYTCYVDAFANRVIPFDDDMARGMQKVRH